MSRIKNLVDLLDPDIKTGPVSPEKAAYIRKVQSYVQEYKPKLNKMVVSKEYYPELFEEEFQQAFRDGNEVGSEYSILELEKGLLNDFCTARSIPMVIQSMTIDERNRGEASITFVHSHEPLIAYLWDTLTVEQGISASDMEVPVKHVTEIDAHLKETHPGEAFKHFFSALLNYEVRRDKACPDQEHEQQRATLSNHR